MKKHLLVMLVAVGACAKPAGGPLSHTFDNSKIAAVSLDSKKSVTEAQQQHDLAQLQRARADEEYRDSKVEEEIAEYQADRSVVVSQLVNTKVMGKIVPISGDAAALARKTAHAKVEFTQARRAWLEKFSSSALYAVYAAQAKLELEKARVAQQNNLVPAGFDLSVYEKQLDARSHAAQDASAASEKDRQTAEAKLTAWNELEKSFMQAAGLTGPAESDRVKLDWEKVAEPPKAETSADASAAQTQTQAQAISAKPADEPAKQP